LGAYNTGILYYSPVSSCPADILKHLRLIFHYSILRGQKDNSEKLNENVRRQFLESSEMMSGTTRVRNILSEILFVTENFQSILRNAFELELIVKKIYVHEIYVM